MQAFFLLKCTYKRSSMINRYIKQSNSMLKISRAIHCSTKICRYPKICIVCEYDNISLEFCTTDPVFEDAENLLLHLQIFLCPLN